MKNTDRISRARKAIAAERAALAKLPALLNRGLAQAMDIIDRSGGSIIVTGMGKSGFIGMKIAATLTSLGRPAFFLHPVEALHGDIGIVRQGDVVLALSFSGRTQEVVRVCRYLHKNYGTPIISLTGSAKSPLAHISQVAIEIDVKDEGSPLGLAPMASTTATLAVGDALAAGLVSPKLFSRKHFARLHPSGGLGMELRAVREVMRPAVGVPRVRESASLLSVVGEITKKRVGIAAVLNAKGALSGVITDGDIRRFLLRKKDIGMACARDVMTAHPKSVDSYCSLKEALSRMEKYKVTSLFVLNKRKAPTGFVHMHDIVTDTLA